MHAPPAGWAVRPPGGSKQTCDLPWRNLKRHSHGCGHLDILIEKHLMTSTLKLVDVLGDATCLHLPPRQQKPRSCRISYLIISYTAFYEVKLFHFEASFEFILRVQAHKSCRVEVHPPKIPPTCFLNLPFLPSFFGIPSPSVMPLGYQGTNKR